MPYSELVSHLLQGQEPMIEHGISITQLPDGKAVVEVYEISIRKKVIGLIR